MKNMYGSVNSNQTEGGQIGHQSQMSPNQMHQNQRKARSINQRIKNPKIYQSAVEMMQNQNTPTSG